MEHASGILAAISGNWVLLIIIALVLAAGIIAVKKGWISFQGKGFYVGIQDKEREIIRTQIQYINTRLDGTIRDLPAHLTEGLHYYRTKYVISKVKDLYEEAIIYNHIKEGSYVSLKQEIIYNTILDLTVDDFFKKPEFKEYLYKLVEETFKRLIEIRNNNSN